MTVENLRAVPHLTTTLTGPLLQLERRLLDMQTQIEVWFRREWQKTPAPFYSSVDVRNAGFKVAPVDTNLFPAGFNNLNPAFHALCIHAVQTAIERYCSYAVRVLIVAESHTRNLYYLDNIATLRDIIHRAGLDVRVAMLPDALNAPQDVALPSGRTLHVEPLQRNGDTVGVANFVPCLVLLNNDLSSGRPSILENISQAIAPPLALGWSTRLKSTHFMHYGNVAAEFARMVDIDPWLIDPLFSQCGEINFMKREGEECLQGNVENLFHAVQAKYDEYGIDKKPFVIVKADAGTYGMAIMTVRDPAEMSTLNRKQRTRMSAMKGGQDVTKVIIQEGVYTFETWGPQQAVAEPVVYMIDRFVVGGFYRIHKEKGTDENLNSPGMEFEPLAFAEPCCNPDSQQGPDANPNRFYAYGVIGRLAALAAAREIAAQEQVPTAQQTA